MILTGSILESAAALRQFLQHALCMGGHMGLRVEVSLEQLVIGFSITLVIVMACGLIVGTFIGFTARDAQVEGLREDFKKPSAEKRSDEKARMQNPANLGRPGKAEKIEPREWFRLHGAGKKKAALVT